MNLLKKVTLMSRHGYEEDLCLELDSEGCLRGWFVHVRLEYKLPPIDERWDADDNERPKKEFNIDNIRALYFSLFFDEAVDALE